MSTYEEVARQRQALIDKIPVVSVDVLPPNAKYQLIDMISFQSTLGTGFFSEFGSDISNIFGTEAKMMNKKIGTSIDKCKQSLRVMAYQLGANAVIGTDFDLSTNTRDATTVAAQGTAIYVDNIEEVFRPAGKHPDDPSPPVGDPVNVMDRQPGQTQGEYIETVLTALDAKRSGDFYEWRGAAYGSFGELLAAAKGAPQ